MNALGPKTTMQSTDNDGSRERVDSIEWGFDDLAEEHVTLGIVASMDVADKAFRSAWTAAQTILGPFILRSPILQELLKLPSPGELMHALDPSTLLGKPSDVPPSNSQELFFAPALIGLDPTTTSFPKDLGDVQRWTEPNSYTEEMMMALLTRLSIGRGKRDRHVEVIARELVLVPGSPRRRARTVR